MVDLPFLFSAPVSMGYKYIHTSHVSGTLVEHGVDEQTNMNFL